jgi:hypothetical protein
VVSEVVVPDSEDLSFQIGLEQAEIYHTGRIGQAWPDGSVDIRVPGTAQATLDGSVALLVDSSYSMEELADLDCTGECETKLDVVRTALDSIADDAPSGVEIGVWSFESDYPGDCPVGFTELSDWTLSREDTASAGGRLYTTWGTPLTGAVHAAISNLERGTWGHAQRLIVLADGDNNCGAGLDSLSVPARLEIHTIGVGIAEGSAAELELQAIASRTGGSYTRTTGGTALAEALTSVAAAPFALHLPESIEVEVRAEGYISRDFDFPVDSDDVTVLLEPEEDRDGPRFILVLPDDPLPDLEDAATLALITERRAARPEHVFIMPDREVDAGGWPTAFAWLEVDPNTGELAALTHDGLHGAAVVYIGATIAGMWSGLHSVVSNFEDCVLEPDGCGDDIEAITQSLCSETSPEAAVHATYVSLIGTLFASVSGYMIDTHFNRGMAVVRSMCMGSADLSGYVHDQAGAAGSAGVGGVAGGAAGFGFTVWWNHIG